MKKYLLITILFSIASGIFAQSNRIDNWETDINYLKKRLPKKHINLFCGISKQEFNTDLDVIISELSILNDVKIAVKLQQALVKVGDTHTNIYWQKFIRKYRDKGIAKSGFKAYSFKDGLYIIESRIQNSEIVGKKIKSINGVDVEVVIDSLKTMFVNENESVIKLKVAELISNDQLLNYFGFAPNTHKRYIDIEVIDSTGNELQHKLDLNGGKYYTPYLPSYSLIQGESNEKNVSRWFYDRYNIADFNYYVQYNKCWSKELEIKYYGASKEADLMPSFSDFSNKVIKTLCNDSIKKIIFDLRYNGGGSSPQGSRLIDSISHIDKVNNKQRIFVIIGRKTFSSAVLNTLDFKEKTDAILIGEDTYGKPSHYGEVRTITLPNSKLKIGYSTKYFYKGDYSKTYFSKRGISRVNDDRNTIHPDYYIELTFSDFANSVDPVFEWIKEK